MLSIRPSADSSGVFGEGDVPTPSPPPISPYTWKEMKMWQIKWNDDKLQKAHWETYGLNEDLKANLQFCGVEGGGA